MPHHVERGLAAGFFRYLTKPVNLVALHEAVQAAAATGTPAAAAADPALSPACGR